MITNYYMPVNVFSGKGVVSEFDKYRRLGEKCVIISGKNLHKLSPVFDDLYDVLKKNDIAFDVFYEVENNPSVKTVKAAVEKVKNADFVIGVGGGSSMDAAKASALLANNKDVYDIFDSSLYKNPPIPLILIGTTAGTGSEVTAASVLTTEIDGVKAKRTVKSPISYASYALCDATYTQSLSHIQTVSTALDSVSHAIEAYFSQKVTECGKMFALKALEIVIRSLNEYCSGVDTYELRKRLLDGSIYAGYAINDGGTSFAHSLGYQLTNFRGYPHGISCALFLEQFLSRMPNIDAILNASGFISKEEMIAFIKNLLNSCMKYEPITVEDSMLFSNIGFKMPSLNNHIGMPVTYEDCIVFYKNLIKRI